MSIEISKVVEIYQQCMAMLEAKHTLYTLAPLAPPMCLPHPEGHLDTCTMMISNGLQSIMKIWLRKFCTLAGLDQENQLIIKELQVKSDALKNNTDLLTKEEQCLTEMEKIVAEWTQITDPLLYYDIRKRTQIKEQLLEKMKQIRDCSAATRNTAKPMYSRKTEQEFKATLYEAYIKAYGVDRKSAAENAQGWCASHNRVCEQGKSMKNFEPIRYISSESRALFQQYSGLLMDKKVKITKNQLHDYCESIKQVAKKVATFWNSYRKSIDHLVKTLQVYIKAASQAKDEFSKKQAVIINLLQKPNQTLSQLFGIQTLFNNLISIGEMFQIIDMLSELLKAVRPMIELIAKNRTECEQFLKKLGLRVEVHEAEFLNVVIEDKNFIKRQVKNEASIDKMIIDGYYEFLSSCEKKCRTNFKRFTEHSEKMYENHQVCGLVGREIISSEGKPPNDMMQSRYSTGSDATRPSNRNKERSEKISKIELFLNKLYIFDYEAVNWESSNVFSCALGPKLLLHGRLLITEEGTYFQSLFNKKNLFFGRTRIYIPKAEIIQLDIGNTLVIFPDAIELKTSKGAVYFHSLSNRSTIQTVLSETYFPENGPDGGECEEEVGFVAPPNNSEQSYSPAEIEELVKPYQIFMTEKTYKNMKLNRFYRRYLSDDKFEVRGQEHQNFRTFFLKQIECIDPSSSPMTPEHPSYFFYKNEQINDKVNPKLSERYHMYRKAIPKIPFVSSGGESECEDKQVYHWISPSLLVVTQVCIVKGFSLTQGMELIYKTSFKQIGEDLKVHSTGTIKFARDVSTNSLVKGPAVSNLKDSQFKMFEYIEKHEKSRKGKARQNNGNQKQATQDDDSQQTIQNLRVQVTKLKKWLKLVIASFIIFYITTLLLIFIF